MAVTCPQCGTKLAVSVVETDLGKNKPGACPRCQKKFLISVPTSLAIKFESDPTMGGNEPDRSLLLEVMKNDTTAYQSFNLTSDYYTIGRKNSSGPEHRPDVEVETADKKMSRKHAAIRKKKTGFTLKDLASKNGVWLNGIKMDAEEEVYLDDGDQFRLGETTFLVNTTETNNDLTC